jgi:hypothetical protein
LLLAAVYLPHVSLDFGRCWLHFLIEDTGNYVARKFGCRSGMPGFVAKKLCPELVLLPLNFDKYNSKAAEIREVLVEYDPRFESASIDEAYLNITEYCARQGLEPTEAVSKMRQEVQEKTKITGETVLLAHPVPETRVGINSWLPSIGWDSGQHAHRKDLLQHEQAKRTVFDSPRPYCHHGLYGWTFMSQGERHRAGS